MQHAGYKSQTTAENPLIAGPRAVETQMGVLASGTLAAGAIVGQVLDSEPVAAAVAGNTGTGAMGAVTLGAGARPGVYRVVFVEPATGLGTFIVEAPNGAVIGTGKVGTAFTGPVNFTIADGDPDFVAGDSFTITVASASNVALCTAAATDGSQQPIGIAAHDADATTSPAEILIYTHGDFAYNQVSVGAGLTVSGVAPFLRELGIHLKQVGN